MQRPKAEIKTGMAGKGERLWKIKNKAGVGGRKRETGSGQPMYQSLEVLRESVVLVKALINN